LPLPPGQHAPALTPVLLFGFAIRPLPLAPLRAGAALAMATMLRRHRSVFERLDGLANPDFLIDPVDLPFGFLLNVALPSPALQVLAETEAPARQPAATIRGPLLALIELLEGRVDGDALFFSRDLAVEGDMGAVVALRNAVDGADISLVEDLVRPLGPLRSPVRRLLDRAGRLYRRAEGDIETLRAAMLAPIQRRCDIQDNRLRELEEQLSAMPRRRKRRA
jgi:predicted lipid carrier protein YhbT